jgi:Carboxypeptidase regulatory-like domain
MKLTRRPASRFRAPRRLSAAALVVLFLAGVVLASAAGAQNFGLRNLQGKVLGDHEAPISGAIVYLTNSRNNDVKTFITTSDGSYRFADLADDTDYTVWAAFQGKKSSRRTLSSFDQRKQAYFDLHISAAAPASSRSGS